MRTLALIQVGARVREFSVGVVHLHVWADAEVKWLLIRKRSAKNDHLIFYVYLFACGFRPFNRFTQPSFTRNGFRPRTGAQADATDIGQRCTRHRRSRPLPRDHSLRRHANSAINDIARHQPYNGEQSSNKKPDMVSLQFLLH